MDDSEFEQRCELQRQALLAYAYVCSGDLHLAEDIVQETLLTAFQKRQQYFQDADFRAWLVAICRNVWLRERDRKRLRERAGEFIHEFASEIFEPDNYPEEQLVQERAALTQCLKKLTPGDLEMIQAHFNAGLKYAQIASRLRQSLAWVKVKMYRIRKALLHCVTLRVRGGET